MLKMFDDPKKNTTNLAEIGANEKMKKDHEPRAQREARGSQSHRNPARMEWHNE